MILGSLAYANPFCVAEYRNVRIMGSKQELTFCFCLTQLVDNSLGDECIEIRHSGLIAVSMFGRKRMPVTRTTGVSPRFAQVFST